MNRFLEGVQWRYISDPGKVLLDRLREIPAGIETVKETRQSRVLRVADHGVYVKEVRYSGLRAMVKTVLGGNAVKEGRIALEMMKRGVDVPQIMAFGIKSSKTLLHADILITREITASKSVHEFMDNDFGRLSFKKKCEYLNRFADFLKKIHDAGIFHRDFHLKNIVIQNPEVGGRFYALDLDKVTLRPGPLPLKKRIGQLGAFLAISWGLLSRTHYFRLMRRYGVNRGKKETGCLVRQVRMQAARHVYRILSQRSRQSLSTNTRFVCNIYHRMTIHVPRNRYYLMGEKRIMDLASQIFEHGPDARRLGSGKQGESGFDLDGHRLIIKRLDALGFRQGSSMPWQLRSGRRAWKNIWRFPDNRIKTPLPVMMIESVQGFLWKKASLVFENVENAIPLDEFWTTINEVDKIGLCAKLAVVIGRMHGMGCSHGDLNWRNVLICRNPAGLDIALTGIEGAGLFRVAKRIKVEKDIALFLADFDRFGSNGKEKAFFLHCWRKWAGIK